MNPVRGSHIRDNCEALGVDPFVIARVLGVHVSSVYRWQTQERAAVSGLQHELLVALDHRLGDVTPEQARDAGAKLLDGVLTGGTLGGLGALLDFVRGDR